MRSKKAVEMSMNVIVIAALVLIVLIVLTFLMTGKLGYFTQSINKCSNTKGAVERASAEQCRQDGGTVIADFYDNNGVKKPNEVCCLLFNNG